MDHRLSNIDTVNMIAHCSNCGIVHIKRRGSITKKGKERYRCAVGYAKTSTTKGISFGYKSGKCEICEQEKTILVQDHNHITGNLRGWICVSCNFSIGYVENKNQYDRYKNIIKYLDKYRD